MAPRNSTLVIGDSDAASLSISTSSISSISASGISGTNDEKDSNNGKNSSNASTTLAKPNTSSSSRGSRKPKKNILNNFTAFYFYLLDHYPVLTKACTQATLSFFANIIAQKFVKKQAKLDWKTIFVFSATNFCSSPLIHFWYKILRTNVKSVPLSILLDQTLFQTVYTSYFFSMLRIFRDFQLSKIPSDVRENLLPTLKNSWKIWPIAQTINFNFVPIKYNVLFGNMVGFFWGIILAAISNKK